MATSRETIVVKASLISIVTNIVLVGFKITVGVLAHSIAIVSDAINNLSDALSGIITIVGAKLASKAPDRKHPFGYGRIEYVTALAVSTIVLYAGVTTLIESIKKIFSLDAVNYNATTLIILTVGIIVKLTLGLYVKKTGQRVKSDSLIASGADALNDAIISSSVLASTIIYLLFHVNLAAYVGILISILIIKTGLDLIRESITKVLGARVDGSLALAIKREVLKEKQVHGAFDLMLNDYGPDKYLGSIHIEVPDTMTAAEIDHTSRNITRNIADKFGVMLHTIGVYSVDPNNQRVAKAKATVEQIVFSHPEVLQMHGFYIDERRKTLSFDIIIDFRAKNRDAIYRDICHAVQRHFSKYTVNITLDVDTSD
ncbi:cation transporter [Candidatus Saccharibacteria bacterium]|nr:cation transporter [Candidatus Saccharibacteria bacterium]